MALTFVTYFVSPGIFRGMAAIEKQGGNNALRSVSNKEEMEDETKVYFFAGTGVSDSRISDRALDGRAFTVEDPLSVEEPL